VLTAAEADAGLTAMARLLTAEQRSAIENRRNNAELADAVEAALGSAPRTMQALAKAAAPAKAPAAPAKK